MTSSDDANLHAQVQHLLERAAGIKLVALGFGYPSADQVRATGQAFERIPTGSAMLDPDTTRIFEAARTAWFTADEAGLQLEFTRLFLGNAPCPPHETSYGDARRIAGHAVELADIGGFYEAFGFTLSTDNPDLPDHLCTELEFYSLLLVKQAYARHAAQTEHQEVTARAARSFLEQHLGRWTESFTAGLAEHRAPSPYLALGRLLTAFIRAECGREGVSPVPLQGRQPPDVMQQDVLTCPMAQEQQPTTLEGLESSPSYKGTGGPPSDQR
jgi:TorA maturation chaperone TorD